MKKAKKLLTLALAACMSLSLVACGKSSTTTSSNPTASGETKYADKITIGRPMDSDNLDPVTCDGNQNIWMFELMLEGLVKTDDAGNEIEPCLADSWDISEDGLTYTFHLKKDVKFSNGDPVTIDDWIWSLERARDTKESEWNFAGAPIANVAKGGDDNTLVVTLTSPCSAFLAYCCMFNMAVQEKSYFESVGEDAYKAKPIGTGAYMLSEWKQGESITFIANPNYYVDGCPKTKELDFVIVSDDSSRLMQLQAGQIDIMTYVPNSAVSTIKSDSKLVCLEPESTEVKYVLYNLHDSVLSNQDVRTALRYATDKQNIIDMVFNGNASIATSFVSASSQYLDKDLKDVDYSVDKAKELLTQAGYPNGLDLTLMYRSGDEAYEQIAVALQSQWAKAGVKVTLDPEEKAVMSQKRSNGDYQAALWMWTDDVSDPSEFMDFFLNPSKTDGLHTGYNSQECYKLETDALTQNDFNARMSDYKTIQETVFKDTPIMTLCYVPYTVATSSSIRGFIQTPLGNYRFDNLAKAAG